GEEKRGGLRGVKGLEFEGSVGKISEDDYQALVAKYRAEAKRLLKAIEEDAGPERKRAEQLVEKRLVKEGLLEGAGDYRVAPADAKPKPAKGRKAKAAREPKPAPVVEPV